MADFPAQNSNQKPKPKPKQSQKQKRKSLSKSRSKSSRFGKYKNSRKVSIGHISLLRKLPSKING